MPKDKEMSVIRISVDSETKKWLKTLAVKQEQSLSSLVKEKLELLFATTYLTEQLATLQQKGFELEMDLKEMLGKENGHE